MRPSSWPLLTFALRVPLLCASLIAGLAPLGAFPFSPFRGMLEGLFDVSGIGAVWVGLAAWLAISACWISALVTLNYGPRRLPGLGARPRPQGPESFHPYPGLALALALAPVSVLAGVLFVSEAKAAVAIGALAGALAYAATWLPLRSFRRPLMIASKPLSRLLALDPAGYRDPASGHLLAGHLFAAQFAVIFVSLYTTVGVAKYYALTEHRGGTSTGVLLLPPSLAYVLLLIGLLALIFSGLAFFFDRYRIPVLLPWLALLSLTSLVPSADHLVETVTLPARPSLATPESILLASPTPILVCASGGGIQAAAWSAAVLTGLERHSPGRFSSALQFFSGASGGSVGGMHFLAAYSANGRLSPAALDDVFEASTRSSLDAAAWGLVGPDLLRATVPFAGRLLGPIGRGWALEQSWDPSRRLRRPLTAWRNRPAVAFNATEVESGRGIALGNIDLEPELRGFQHRLNRRSPYVDLSPVSAARLSASFPYVTPTPRAANRTAHYADGGYYDNYGVGAAIALLEAAYRERQRPGLPTRILLIEIRATRSPAPGPNAPPPASPLLFQWLAPLSTILNVRDAAQRERNDTTLDLLTRTLAARDVRLQRVIFEAPRYDVPLSWHLTAPQIDAVRRDWRERYDCSPESAAVARFLAQQ